MDFIVFSDDWGGHPSSAQHLFRQIARDHRVLWVNTVGMRAPKPTLVDARKSLRKVGNMLSPKLPSEVDRYTQGSLQLTVVQPAMLPLPGSNIARKFNDWSGLRTVRHWMNRLDMRKPVVVATVPNVCGIVGELGAAAIAYYCVDDFAQWPGSNFCVVRSMERCLVTQSDVVFATSARLYENLRAFGVDTYLLEHGVDLDTFGAPPGTAHQLVEGLPRPRAGFFGLIDERLDQDLVAEVAQLLPEWTFVFAGPRVIETRLLDAFDNIRMIGAVPYDQLPRLVDGLDVLVLPYRVNELTDTISPLKVNEYLATGSPVVASPLLELKRENCWVRLAEKPNEWKLALCDALRDSKIHRRNAILPTLQRHSWDQRATLLMKKVLAHARHG